LCQWCDYRAHCPDGQQAGPEKPSWAALEEITDERVDDEEDRREYLEPGGAEADPSA
jgi:hypothetical protein